MIVGLDLDNTIVCYDEAIKRLANDVKQLPQDTPRTKLGIRDFLRQENREDEWTEFQGELYGPGMSYADPFPGALETIAAMQNAGHSAVIISHRTQFPYLGPKYDLHQSARDWIEKKLVLEGKELIASDNIYLNETKDQKVSLVQSLKCDVFLDDLIEILSHDAFPSSVQKLWFSQNQTHNASKIPNDVQVIEDWTELAWLSEN
jgi:hypothetical protein